MEVYEDLLGLGAKRTASYNMCHVWCVKKKSKTFSHSNLSDPTFKVFLGMPCIAPDCSLFVLTSLSSNLHKDQSSKFCFRLIHILHP